MKEEKSVERKALEAIFHKLDPHRDAVLWGIASDALNFNRPPGPVHDVAEFVQWWGSNRHRLTGYSQYSKAHIVWNASREALHELAPPDLERKTLRSIIEKHMSEGL